MAEYESGYCTGCGMKARKWGHRPYCWRVVGYIVGDGLSKKQIERALERMEYLTPLWMRLLCRRKHMYYFAGRVEVSAPHIETQRGPFLFEQHAANCNCSYCWPTSGLNALHYGLNIPRDWRAWNSWWVIKYAPRRYVRWTNSWLRQVSK